MQDATCSLKSQGIHHPWSLQSVAEAGHHTEETAASANASESAVMDQSDRAAQPVDATLNAVASSLSRLALTATDVSPPGLPPSLAPVTTTGWPNDADIFQPSGYLQSATNGLPAISLAGGVNSSIGANGIHPSFPSNTPQQHQQRRAITGHAPMSASDTFGIAASGNGGSSFASWNNTAVPSWLQSGRATNSMPTRFGPVHHGRSMSVQNINLTGNAAAAPQRKLGNQYMSRGSSGIFGGTPSLSGLGIPARGQTQGAEQFGARYPAIDEKSLLASLGQEVSPSMGLEAQWLDLIRSAVQEQVRRKLPFGLLDNLAGSFGGTTSDTLALEKHLALTNANLAAAVSAAAGLDRLEIYSRKVFVGGLPPDIDEDEIMLAFRRFGPLVVDWPHKAESKSYFPPKGYCFLLFQDELSVQALVEACTVDDGKLYWCVSSPTMKDKPVQVRPWNLSDADFVMDGSQPLDPRKTVFVGGVPRPLRAVELAMIMGRLYGGVCYAGIDTDPELKYPKGAGRVAFSSQQSYIAAISARFVQLQHGDIDKRVEVKPYVLDDQICDECAGVHSGGKFAPFFCANVTCLQYYCEPCWARIHSTPGREFHKPLVKEGADRPRAMPFRWC